MDNTLQLKERYESLSDDELLCVHADEGGLTEIAQCGSLSIPLLFISSERSEAERMPARASTKRGYDAWLANHILPRWVTASSQKCRLGPSSCGCNL
jgi:hypothetical protein